MRKLLWIHVVASLDVSQGVAWSIVPSPSPLKKKTNKYLFPPVIFSLLLLTNFVASKGPSLHFPSWRFSLSPSMHGFRFFLCLVWFINVGFSGSATWYIWKTNTSRTDIIKVQNVTFHLKESWKSRREAVVSLPITVKMGEKDRPAAEVGWRHRLPRQIRKATCLWEDTLEKGRAQTTTWLSETEASILFSPICLDLRSCTWNWLVEAVCMAEVHCCSW